MSKVLKLEELAELLRVHPSTIYRLLRKRKIPGFKLGSEWRFSQKSVERWVKERESDTGSDQSPRAPQAPLTFINREGRGRAPASSLPK
jgi:excisionase family DNA binding protein